MQPDFFDNRTRIVKDDLVRTIQSGDRISIAASVFSMYAYQELKSQLADIDELQFIFTSQAFTKQHPSREKREFYIPRPSREQGSSALSSKSSCATSSHKRPLPLSVPSGFAARPASSLS